MGKPFISPEQAAGRITKHGQITDLTSAFDLSGTPFSIVIIPKANVTAGVISSPTNTGLIVSCEMANDTAGEYGDYPVYFNRETPALIVSIEAAAIDLTTYDVYWAS